MYFGIRYILYIIDFISFGKNTAFYSFYKINNKKRPLLHSNSLSVIIKKINKINV